MDQPATSGDLKILQLTDCHLHHDPDKSLLGINTQQSLEEVVASILASGERPDAVVATGDLVHDGSESGYRRLARSLALLGAPALALPGNHDAPRVMERVLGAEGIQVCGQLEIGNWRLILLDSHQPEQEGGRLAPEELERLDALLEDDTHHVLIFVHHHPLPIGCRWLDRISLANGDALLERVRTHPQVKGILWGHVHQSWEGRLGQAQLLGTPSTCIQFAPGEDEFALALEPPAWRQIRLQADGTLSSHVHHLHSLPLGLAVDSLGY